MFELNTPSALQLILFLSAFYIIFILIIYIVKNKKVFNRKLKEYVWVNKFYFLGAMLVVFLQYLAMSWPQSARIGQLLWELMIVLSVIILVKKYKFNLKNIIFLGILYALWIHGAKISLRYFIYGNYDIVYKTVRYIAGRFVYGSVLAIALAIGTFFALSLLNEVNKKQKDTRKIAEIILWLILIVVILLVALIVYGKYA